MPSARRRWCRTLRPTKKAVGTFDTLTGSPLRAMSRGAGRVADFDRQLGRRLRPRLGAPLSAAGPPRPADRLLAPADAVLVVGRPCRACTPAAKSIVWHVLLFFIGAFAMRGAGCTWNDIVDRDLDARVERTRSRPIPSGQVTVASAAAFLVAAGVGRACGSAAVQSLHDLCRLRVARRGRGLSFHEADHLLAADRAWASPSPGAR